LLRGSDVSLKVAESVGSQLLRGSDVSLKVVESVGSQLLRGSDVSLKVAESVGSQLLRGSDVSLKVAEHTHLVSVYIANFFLQLLQVWRDLKLKLGNCSGSTFYRPDIVSVSCV